MYLPEGVDTQCQADMLEHSNETVREIFLRNRAKFEFEDKGGMCRNVGLGIFAIAQFGRDVYFPFVTHAHVLHSDDPALNKLVEPEGDRYRAWAGVEFLAVDGAACIMNCDNTTLRGMLTVIPAGAGADHLVIYPFGKRPDTIFLRLDFQPLFIGSRIFLLFHIVYFVFS